MGSVPKKGFKYSVLKSAENSDASDVVSTFLSLELYLLFSLSYDIFRCEDLEKSTTACCFIR